LLLLVLTLVLQRTAATATGADSGTPTLGQQL